MAKYTHENKFNEVEFVACLLVTGPPDYISYRPATASNKYPVSTQKYRNQCRIWYEKSLGLPCTQREFEGWWLNYKKWLIEHHRD